MADTDELLAKITDFVGKTGFPLERDCARILSSRDWVVSKGPSFLDADESILRELDISAVKATLFSRSPPRLGFVTLMVECKKSERPWIFFSDTVGFIEPLWGIQYTSSIERLLPSGPLAEGRVSVKDLAGWGHPHRDVVPQTKTYVEYDPKPDKASGHNIRSALLTAVKSADDQMSRMKETFARGLGGYAFFYYPVVVLRGRMYDATSSDAGRTEVKSVDRVRVEVDYLPPSEPFSYTRMRHVVDVLSEDALPRYVESIDRSHTALFARIAELLDKPEPRSP